MTINVIWMGSDDDRVTVSKINSIELGTWDFLCFTKL